MPPRPVRITLWRPLIVMTLVAWVGAACGSSSISTTAPTGSKCQVSVSSSLQTAPFAGAPGTATVTTNRDCTWAATTAAPWISITSGATGQGDGTVSFRVAPNSDPTSRRGTLSVNDAAIELTQEPAPCRFTVSASPTALPASGGAVHVSVTASVAACAWSAHSNVGWIAVVSGANGSGDGSVTLGVAANTGDTREGSVLVAGETIVVRQDGVNVTPPPPPPPECTYTVTPPTQTVPASGGAASVAVATNVPSCGWNARSDASWITFVNGSGTGGGSATFNVAGNSGGARTATLTIGTATASVSQAAAACSFSIAPSSASFGAAGGNGSMAVTLTAGAGCAWTATANVPWVSITGGASGSGNGSVAFSVAANAGAARTGTITAAGQTFTIVQAAACSYSIAPVSQAVPAAGGSGSITVTAGAGCAWTAAANVAWITITSGVSGAGSGTVAFSVAANVDAVPRSGTLTVAGQTFTVNQDAATCAFSIAPTSQAFDVSGGTGAVTVTASGACTWTATSNNTDWLSITSGATGTGNGSVTFSVAPNAGPARTGTLIIGGQTFTATQAGG